MVAIAPARRASPAASCFQNRRWAAALQVLALLFNMVAAVLLAPPGQAAGDHFPAVCAAYPADPALPTGDQGPGERRPPCLLCQLHAAPLLAPPVAAAPTIALRPVLADISPVADHIPADTLRHYTPPSRAPPAC